jgi:hypothetical protein
MGFRKGLAAIERAILADDLSKATNIPFLHLVLQSGLPLPTGLREQQLDDPTPAQFAAFHDKPSALRSLLDLSSSLSIPFASVFSPSSSNTAANLLTLAARSPGGGTDSLALLLERVAAERLQVDPGGEALAAAIEARNAAAIRALVRAGANLLAGRLCPLVLALFAGRDVLRIILDSATTADAGGVQVDVTDFFLGPNWDEETLAAVHAGGASPLRKILALRGLAELSEFVRQLETEPKDERKKIEIGDPTDPAGADLFL